MVAASLHKHLINQVACGDLLGLSTLPEVTNLSDLLPCFKNLTGHLESIGASSKNVKWPHYLENHFLFSSPNYIHQ